MLTDADGFAVALYLTDAFGVEYVVAQPVRAANIGSPIQQIGMETDPAGLGWNWEVCCKLKWKFCCSSQETLVVDYYLQVAKDIAKELERCDWQKGILPLVQIIAAAGNCKDKANDLSAVKEAILHGDKFAACEAIVQMIRSCLVGPVSDINTIAGEYHCSQYL